MVNVVPDNEAFTRPSTLDDAAGVLACTNAVVATCVVSVAVAAVGAAGVPVNVGLAIFAFKLSAVVTKAVVAICVVLVLAAAVGASGVPVRVSPDMSALELIAVCTAVNSELKSAPDITLFASESASASFPDQETANV
jgi:hypothetical protein